jgi:putative DNA primase/helicase
MLDSNRTQVIPSELNALRQFVFWRYADRDGPKPSKVPITAWGRKAKTNDSEHWSHYSYLQELLQKQPEFADGIGFVFTKEDPFCGIDLDNIWISDATETPIWAQQIRERFHDTYTEESPSGKGLKIWCRAELPGAGREWTVGQGAVEFYDRGRFFAITGRSNRVLAITEHQPDVDSLIAHLDGSGRRGPAAPIGEKIPFGTQHRTLVSLAGTMHRRGMCTEAIEAALQVVNEKQCEKPGPPENIRRIARSVARYPR